MLRIARLRRVSSGAERGRQEKARRLEWGL